MVLPIHKQQTSARQQGGTKSLIDWYHKTSDIILDKVCCCSYLNAQVGIEEAKTRTYYKTRPNDWLFEDDEVYDDYDYYPSSPSPKSIVSIGKESRNPPHTATKKEKDYRFDLDDEWALLASSSSSKETATTVLLAESNSTETFEEEGEEYQESFFVASSESSSSYCGSTKFNKDGRKYDKENANYHMMGQQQESSSSRLAVNGCGGMPPYNFQLVDDARDSTPIRSNLPRFRKTQRHEYHPDRPTDDFEDRRHCRNHEGVVMQSQQKMKGGYNRHVLREVQFEGRAKLPFLNATQGVEC